MSSEILTLMVGLVSSGGGVALFSYLQNRSKSRAEALKIQAETGDVIDQRYDRLVDRLTKRIDELENENMVLMSELRKIRDTSMRLEYKLGKISSLMVGGLDDDTKQKEPYRSIIRELTTWGDAPEEKSPAS